MSSRLSVINELRVTTTLSRIVFHVVFSEIDLARFSYITQPTGIDFWQDIFTNESGADVGTDPAYDQEMPFLTVATVRHFNPSIVGAKDTFLLFRVGRMVVRRSDGPIIVPGSGFTDRHVVAPASPVDLARFERMEMCVSFSFDGGVEGGRGVTFLRLYYQEIASTGSGWHTVGDPVYRGLTLYYDNWPEYPLEPFRQAA
jgi:hypothetical protein